MPRSGSTLAALDYKDPAALSNAVRSYWRTRPRPSRPLLDARPLDALPPSSPAKVAAAHAARRESVAAARRRRLQAAGRPPRMRTPCSGNRYPLFLDDVLRATCRCHWMEEA